MVTWLKNPNSQKYKQLEYTLNKMDERFTVKDMQNFLKYSWEVHGQNHSRGADKKRRVYGYTGQAIARFLKTRNDIVVINKIENNFSIYKKRNYNENVDDRPEVNV